MHKTKPALFSRLVMTILIVFSLAITGYASFRLDRFAKKSVEKQAWAESQSSTDLLKRRIEVYADSLYAERALFAASDSVSAEEWKRFVSSQLLFNRYPGVSAVSYIAKVKNADKTQFENDLLAGKKIYPPNLKDNYWPITYVESQPGQTAAYGFDLSSNPGRWSTMQEAITKGEPVATGPIALMPSAEKGFIIMMPLFENKDNPTNTDASAVGFVNAVFKFKELFDTVYGSGSEHSNSGVKITARGGCTENCEVYRSLAYKDEAQFISHTIGIEVASQTWDLEFKTPRDYKLNVVDRYASIVTLIGGLLFAFLLFLTVSFRNSFQ